MRFGTVDEVAEILRIKPDTAYRWAASGYLPCIRMGRGTHRRALRFNLETVHRWAEKQAQPGRYQRIPQIDVGGLS